MVVLASSVEHVIGIDPDRDRVTASVVDTATTGEQATAMFETTRKGYERLLKWADEHTQTAGRVWSVEGTGSYGAGVASYLTQTCIQATKCARFRLTAPMSELTATKQALRSLARRIRALTTEIDDLKESISELVEALAPHLLNQRGVGPITAAQVLIAWSHPGRCRNEAAFARLAGVAPLQASSGQHTRHRLNRRGDRQLNHSYL